MRHKEGGAYPQTGVPVKMFIDTVPDAIDDELGIEISSFVVG